MWSAKKKTEKINLLNKQSTDARFARCCLPKSTQRLSVSWWLILTAVSCRHQRKKNLVPTKYCVTPCASQQLTSRTVVSMMTSWTRARARQRLNTREPERILQTDLNAYKIQTLASCWCMWSLIDDANLILRFVFRCARSVCIRYVNVVIVTYASRGYCRFLDSWFIVGHIGGRSLVNIEVWPALETVLLCAL